VLPILGTDPHASRETETLKVKTLEAEIGKQEAHDGQDGALGEHALPLFEWKHNALRHSFCSYRLAEVKRVVWSALLAVAMFAGWNVAGAFHGLGPFRG